MSPKNKTSLVEFAERILGADLYDIQREILTALETDRQIAVKAAHATGKTFAAACAALAFAALYADSRVLTIHPGWIGLRSVIWAEVHSLLARAKFKLPTTNMTQTEIKFSEKNMITA